MGGLAARVDEVLAEIPMKEAVRYKKGNLKWTRSDVKSHSEALACGLIELGCKVCCSMTITPSAGNSRGNLCVCWLNVENSDSRTFGIYTRFTLEGVRTWDASHDVFCCG